MSDGPSVEDAAKKSLRDLKNALRVAAAAVRLDAITANDDDLREDASDLRTMHNRVVEILERY